MLEPQQTPEQNIELVFPLRGIDSSNEYDRQPQGTTIDGENVRAFESLTQRARGGSRSGLNKYIPDVVAALNSPVQNLNFVVSVSEDALLTAGGFVSGDGDAIVPPPSPPGGGGGSGGGDGGGAGPGGGPGGPGGGAGVIPFPPGSGSGAGNDDTIEDPSTSNRRRRQPLPFKRLVRRKGDGRQIQRNQPKKRTTQPISRVQSAINTADTVVTLSVSFAAQPGVGHLLVAVVSSLSNVVGTNYTVSGTGVGTTYTLAETAHLSIFGVEQDLTIWYRICGAAVSDEQTVNISSTVGPISFDGVLIEYKNAAQASPLDAVNTNSDAGFPTTWTAGNVAVNGGNEVVIGAFGCNSVDMTGLITPLNGFGIVKKLEIAVGVGDMPIWVVDKFPTTVDLTPSMADSDVGGQAYAAVGASFKNG